MYATRLHKSRSCIPEVQERAQRDIDRIVWPGRMPDMHDEPKLDTFTIT